MNIHWKAPLQTKGFLKIIELVVAVLCLSLVAGFGTSGTGTCVHVGFNNTYTLTTAFPFNSYSLRNESTNGGTVDTVGNFVDVGVAQAGQLFVAWGVLSMFYSVVAIVVYMVFTANEEWEKIMDCLVYMDLAFHVAWVLCWFIASVDWAVAYNRLVTDITQVIHSQFFCNTAAVAHASYAQAGIAVVFGFLSLFLWGANIYWVLIDTPFFIQWRAKRAGTSYSQT